MEQGDGKLTVTALESVRYDTVTGLVPVVVQDIHTGLVLMLAYANREALKRTFGTGQAWFWSRSRREYWHKGATSGNIQCVVEVRFDCDGDSVLYLVRPQGPACHTGEPSCFFRKVSYKGKAPAGAQLEKVEDAAAMVGLDRFAQMDAAILGADSDTQSIAKMGESEWSHPLSRLWSTISDRWETRPGGSYTTYLFEQGVDKVAKKVGEEAVEVALAAKNAVHGMIGAGDATDKNPGQDELVEESADLLYHLLALWKTAGISPSDVYDVLARRAR